MLGVPRRPDRRLLALFLLLLGLLAGGAAAQEEAASEQAPTPTPAPETPPAEVTPTPSPTPEIVSDPAIDLLRRVEEKNRNLETLHGEFTQKRINPMFLEEIESRGEFWYAKPERFRCDYYEPSIMHFYILGREIITYTPAIEQVEIFTTKAGEQEPINQMLVGFGVETEQILEVFNVRMAGEQPEDPGLTSVEFLSTNVDRTLGYRRIVVTFSKESLEPATIYLEDGEDTVTVNLTSVELNAEVDESVFERNFPEDVDVVNY